MSETSLSQATTYSATPIRARMQEWARGAEHIDVAVACLGPSGLILLDEFLDGASVDLTVSVYLRGTRRDVLEALQRKLAEVRLDGRRLRVRVAQQLDKGRFHGKTVRFSYSYLAAALGFADGSGG